MRIFFYLSSLETLKYLIIYQILKYPLIILIKINNVDQNYWFNLSLLLVTSSIILYIYPVNIKLETVVPRYYVYFDNRFEKTLTAY